MPRKGTCLKTGTLKEIFLQRSEMRIKKNHLHLVGRARSYKQLVYCADPDVQVEPKDTC